MFTEPKRGDGLNESKVCYATKQLWAITTFHDTYNEITFKYFIEHITEFIDKYGFDWPKGKKYPEYSTAKDWPKKYDYLHSHNMEPQVGLEPTTCRLQGGCSTN